MIKNFIAITKPGIIFGNLITVAGGFFLASHWQINYCLLLVTLIGISTIIACGCVLNNIFDRDIDQMMERTQNRVMVKHLIPIPIAIIYALLLGFIGSYLLIYYANWLTGVIALLGLFFYVVVYTMAFKRNSIYGTLIGSISGAIPPVVGYCAVTNSFDLGGIILFIMLSIWQMPHSFAIAIFRLADYSRANIPVLPVKKTMLRTKLNMLIYVILFAIASASLSVFNYTNKIYLLISLISCCWWIRLATQGFQAINPTDEIKWARKMFGYSILLITILSVAMALCSS
ncbi:MAG: hypothetical protein RLZZ293_1071 [Pseudomonadota bacterium]